MIRVEALGLLVILMVAGFIIWNILRQPSSSLRSVSHEEARAELLTQLYQLDDLLRRLVEAPNPLPSLVLLTDIRQYRASEAKLRPQNARQPLEQLQQRLDKGRSQLARAVGAMDVANFGQDKQLQIDIQRYLEP
jgi:hypothetical protein